MSSSNNSIEIDIAEACQSYSIDQSKIKEMVDFVCEKFSISNSQISIGIIDDEQMIQVHSDFMDDPTTTDVMSFDLSDDIDSVKVFEIVANADMASRQSEARGHSFQAELTLYVLHGLLHNLGFDDLTEEEFEKMHKTEDEILKSLGYGVIYAKKQ